MPPKKKGANAGKKDAAVDKDKERLRLAQSEIVHLQQHIEIQKQDLLRARQMQKFWQQVCCNTRFRARYHHNIKYCECT